MSYVCDEKFTVVGLAIDIATKASKTIQELAEETYPIVVQAFNNKDFRTSFQKALKEEVSKVVSQGIYHSQKDGFSNGFINATKNLDLVTVPIQKTAEEAFKQHILSSQKYIDTERELLDKASKMKCTPTGLFFDTTLGKWVFYVIVLPVAGTALYFASQTEFVSNNVNKLMTNRRFSKDIPTSFGMINLDMTFLRFKTIGPSIEVKFDKLGITWTNGKPRGTDWQSASAYLQLEGHLEGKELVAKVKGAVVEVQDNSFLLRVATRKSANNNWDLFTSATAKVEDNVSVTLSHSRELNFKKNAESTKSRKSTHDSIFGIKVNKKFDRNEYGIKSGFFDVSKNASNDELIVEIGTTITFKDFNFFEYFDVEATVKRVIGNDRDSILGLKFNIRF